MHPKTQTNQEIRDRINKGVALLNPAHRVLFTSWTTQYMEETGRTVPKFRKQDLVTALTKVRDLYKLQCDTNVEEMFDTKTMSFADRARARARIIKEHMSAAKEKAMRTGKAVKVTLPKITIE